MNFLLGNMIVVKDLASALALFHSEEHKYHYITTEGDHINPFGVDIK